jgi:hypothetical protein
MATIKLFESWLQSQAINELAPIGNLDLSKLTISQERKNEVLATEEKNMIFERIKTFLKKNGISFSCDTETAAYILAKHLIGAYGTKSFNETNIGFTQSETLKLMDYPDDPNLVLTTGIFSEDRIDEPADNSLGSDYATISKFLNNASLLTIAGGGYLYTTFGYRLVLDPTTNSAKAIKNPDKGLRFYGTTTTNPAMSKQEVKTTTWEIPQEGKTITKKLPGTMFATGSIELSDSKELDAAIAELKALLADKQTKITKIQIQSSSSGDRPAADGQTGYPTGTPGTNYPLGKPYKPKAPTESGNAQLAFGRGQTIKSKLSSALGAINMPIEAQIQQGGDAAQFAKLIVTIEMVTKAGVSLTNSELNNLLLKPKSVENLASTKVLKVFAFQNYAATM